MDILTVDTETYYDSDFSLSKMQTDAYILDPRFEVIGVCVAKNDEDPQWYTGTRDEITWWLVGNYDWASSAVRCHKTLFDGFILTQYFGIKPRLWMDTLAQGRMLLPYLTSHSLANLAKHFGFPDKGTEVIKAMGKRRADFNPMELKEYGDYCRHDTWLCRELGRKMDPFTPALEMQLIDMTVRMFTEPKLVGDKAEMIRLYDAEVKRKEELLALATTDRETIMSNDKFAAKLEELGVAPPKKISPTTGKETYAFAKSDKEFTDLLEHDDSEVQALVAARIGVKTTIAETRALKFCEMTARGPLPVYLNFWGAKTTGRYSGGNFCLAGDTVITVLRDGELLDIQLLALEPDDLVWDGQEFVAHGGLVFQGEREVIHYDGITGTPDHKVYVEGRDEPVELAVAAREGLVLQTGGDHRGLGRPAADLLLGAVPVYDIVNCGPRNRFVANGRVVSNCNWQNMPARGPSAGLRKALLAPPGHKVIVGDSSNIELRTVMALAGQWDVVEKLRNGVDLYCDFASKLFGRDITKADKAERQLGKVAMLSLQYGAGAVRFQEMVRIASRNDPNLKPIDQNRAYQIVDLYRSVHDKVVELWERCMYVVLPDIANGCSLINVDVNGWFITQNDGFGRPGEPGVMYNDLKYEARNKEWTYRMGKQRVRIFGPKVVENLSQHAAMRIVMWQTARINAKYPVKLSVHDEAVTVVRDQDVAAAREYMEECLAMAPKWCRGFIPVACETGVGESYGQAK